MGRRKKVIVIGTGAGGAMAAFELSKTCNVTILEAGKDFHPFSLPVDRIASLRKTGLFLDERMIRLLFPNMQVRKSESMVMVNGIGVGGTTTLATGNAVRCDEMFKEIGLDLDEQYDELLRMLPVTTEHQRSWNRSTKQMFSVFEKMGLDPQPTPKFLRQPQCANCGHCAIGCPTGLKWDTRDLVNEAVKRGAGLIRGCRADRFEIRANEVTGVSAKIGARKVMFRADLVILAAGGFGTPVILENSGIRCQRTLFVDPVLCVAAVRKGFHQDRQLLMPFFSRQDGYMLSPYIDYLSFFFDRRWRVPKQDLVSVMIKMSDDGRGFSDSKKIRKDLTAADKERLARGREQCVEILGRMGISREETFTGILNAGHPGGMLPLNADTKDTLHDPHLPDNLYVADATLFPRSAGMPPILNIMALAAATARTALSAV